MKAGGRKVNKNTQKSTMKTSQSQKTLRSNLIFPIITAIFFLNSTNCYSWSGYDYDNKSAIEIGEGNLVREGLVIQFYDLKNDSYYTVKILDMDQDAGGVKIEVIDLNSDEKRVLMMD